LGVTPDRQGPRHQAWQGRAAAVERHPLALAACSV